MVAKLIKNAEAIQGGGEQLMEKNVETPVDETTTPAEVAQASETKTTTKGKSKAKPKTMVPEAESLTADEDMISVVAAEVENLGQEKAFQEVPTLLNNIDSGYFKLGGVLAVIQAHGWFTDHGYETFRAYIESECGIAYRKAMYLIAIYNGLVESGVSWNKVKNLGWTKLKELATILTKANVDEWVAVAENMTVLQLQDYIKAQAKQASAPADAPAGSEAPSTVSTMTFKVHPDQRETIRAALDKVRAAMGTDSDTVALEHMALDYLAGSGALKKAPTLKDLMTGKSAEEVLGVFEEVFPTVELTATMAEE